MAYSALLSLAQVIDELLPHDEQDYTSLCAKDQMISLHRNITQLQTFLELVPDRCASMTRQLESRLTDVVYRLDDLIQSNVKGSPCPKTMIPDADDITSLFVGCIEQIRSILQDAEKMEEQFKQHMKGASSTSDNDQAASLTSTGEPGSSHAKVGINEDLEQIIERVTSRDKSLQIIPIVGMGGIGKTTLARAVYEDSDIVSHFDLCFWVTVSQEYNVQEILQSLLEGQKPTVEHNAKSASNVQLEAPTDGRNSTGSLMVKPSEILRKEKPKVEPLDVQVHKYLFNRRFLIVMDDMWHPEAWEGVMSAIPKDQTGSRVILTTRSSAVAAKVDASSRQHQMQLMNKESAWELLRENVYICESCLPKFEDVGKRIAERCDGLPLTIVVVGGLLKSNMAVDYWEEVERNINEAASRDGKLDAVLTLSYNNLPAHLKACFLYMGVFPEDFRIPASNLFWLWIAEGFIKLQAPNTPEEIAEEYLEDLVERNLVMVATKRSNGKIRSCSIHDVPRELSLRIAKQEKFLHPLGGENFDDITFRNITTSQRHVSVYSKRSHDTSYPNNAGANTFVRSLVFVNCPVYFNLGCFRLLKVLYGVRVTGESMLRQIFELTNLRLLQFICDLDWHSRNLSVPRSISQLQKLEALTVTKGSKWVYGSSVTIPEDIWKILSLRHIVLPKDDCTLIFPRFHQDYPVLGNLQTLSWDGRGKFTKYVMRKMPKLKKTKEVSLDDSLFSMDDPCELENITIGYNKEPLIIPRSIQKLSIKYAVNSIYKAAGSLPNLQVLKLSRDRHSQKKYTWETKEGEFLQLKHLEMSSRKLKCWLSESAHFPRLEVLVLRNLEYLEEIPLDMGNIGTLKKLIVDGCKSNVNESAERIKEEAENSGNEALQLVITNRKS